jgi:hypothetical protein
LRLALFDVGTGSGEEEGRRVKSVKRWKFIVLEGC